MVTPRVNSNNSFDDNLSLQLRRENSLLEEGPNGALSLSL